MTGVVCKAGTTTCGANFDFDSTRLSFLENQRDSDRIMI